MDKTEEELEYIKKLLATRYHAKMEGNFDFADKIRLQLHMEGIKVDDLLGQISIERCVRYGPRIWEFRKERILIPNTELSVIP